MLKNAAQLWGHQTSDVDSYDPLVGLLMGACATEFEKIYHELYSSQSRLLERLAQLLTPEVNKGPEPAHAIMHLKPIDASTVISRDTQFYAKKSIRNNSVQEEFLDVFFSPANDVHLFNGAVKYLATDMAVFEVNGVIHKERLFNSVNKKKHPETTLWLGLDLHESIEHLDGLSFYFDWLNNPDRDSYYHLLPFSRWFLNGEKINIQIGLTDRKASIEDSLSNEYDILSKQERKVGAYYNHAFITLENNREKLVFNERKKEYPAEFKDVFNEKDLGKLKKGMVWIQIKFPPSVSLDVINEVSCTMNCFPVINRKLNEVTFRLQTDRTNIIPLSAKDDLFLAMNKVKTDTGVEYSSSNSIKDVQKINPGTYVITQGNLERFDSRGAADYLSYLLSLVSNETAAFTAYGQEFVSSSLKEINQIMASLNQKISQKEIGSDQANYLIIKPTDAKNIFIEFWSTAGETGNNVKSGTPLTPYSNYNIDTASAVLILGSSGGKDPLSPQETLNTYKQALMTRERIVTKEDIKVTCLKELGKQVSDIEVQNGWTIDPAAKTGFIKTIDVAITYSDNTGKTSEEWNIICRRLKTILELKSSGFTPFRVFMKE